MKKLIALALLLAPLLAWGQSCPFWQVFTFADGQKGCLGEYPIARDSLPGLDRLERAVKTITLYSVSLPIGNATCPRVAGSSFVRSGASPPEIYRWSEPAFVAERERDSMRACQARLAEIGGNTGCACAPVLESGASKLTKAEFNANFLPGAPQVAVVVQPAKPSQPDVVARAPAPVSCPFWQVLAFADGQRACLGEYPFARATAAGIIGSVQSAVPQSGRYSMAAAMGQGACPAVLGVSAATQQSTSTVSQREQAAMRSCDGSLGRQAGCNCSIIVSDGESKLTKTEFDSRFLNKAPQVAAVAPEPQAPAVTAAPSRASAPAPTIVAAQPAVPVAPVVAPKPGQTEADLARTQELLERMQARLQQLEATRAAVPAPAPPAPVAIVTAPVVPPTPPQTPRLSARALVIGNSRYVSFGALPNPGRDARAIAAKLESFGIPVDLVLDAQRDDIIQALNDHSRRAAGKDVSLFFYAGHGVQVEGINYLIPVNMRGTDLSAGYVKLAGISLNAALDYLPAKTRIVFLDACRDNPATRTLISTRSAAAAGLAPVNAASGTLVAYATRDGATADDGDGINSPYTTALLRHIDTPLDISLVLRQVRQTVLQLTGGKQEPWEYGSLVGEQIVLPQLRQ